MFLLVFLYSLVVFSLCYYFFLGCFLVRLRRLRQHPVVGVHQQYPGAGSLDHAHRRRLRRIRTTTEPPGYEPYNPTAADSSVITSSYTPSATLNGFQPPYPPPQPTPTPAMMLSYDNTGSGYSEAVGSPVPPQELPPHSWHAPEPMSIHSSVPGHYPPPLLEGLSEARSPGPEMKERLRER